MMQPREHGRIDVAGLDPGSPGHTRLKGKETKPRALAMRCLVC